MNKNDIVQGVCLNYTYDGSGVVKIDNYPIFVKGLLQGEEADIMILKMKKTYAFGKIVKIHKVSEDRVDAPCPLFGKCGGCHIQHMCYSAQKDFKAQQVQNLMDRIAKIDIKVPEVVGMDHPFYYRNKAQVPLDMKTGKIMMGFYRVNSNTIVDMETCFIQSPLINQTYQKVKLLLSEYSFTSQLRHVLIKHAFQRDEIMVVLISRQKELLGLMDFSNKLVEQVKEIKSIILNVNDRSDNVILGKEEYLIYGNETITDELNGLKFHISSKSFYQVNPIQTLKLYEKALQYANLTGNEHVIDLYCGVGTISLFMAKHARFVSGIEIVPQAIEDAIVNASMNQIENVEFICDDAMHYAESLVAQAKQVDVVMVDPPRKGLDEVTIQSIVKMNPDRIVYISCDPSTLARDLNRFSCLGYECKEIECFDLFPQSYHVESVVWLSKTK